MLSWRLELDHTCHVSDFGLTFARHAKCVDCGSHPWLEAAGTRPVASTAEAS